MTPAFFFDLLLIDDIEFKIAIQKNNFITCADERGVKPLAVCEGKTPSPDLGKEHGWSRQRNSSDFMLGRSSQNGAIRGG